MVHGREHSAGYTIPSNKTFYSPSSNSSNMMCSYEPSSAYDAHVAGVNNVGNWPIASSQSYNGSDAYVGSDQQRRWMAQQESLYSRRDNRSESRSIASCNNLGLQQAPMSPQYSTATYIDSPQFSRPSSYHASNRASLDMRAPTPNWSSWDMEQTPTPPLNEQRFGTATTSPAWSDINSIPEYSGSHFSDATYASSESSSTIYSPPPDQNMTLNGYAFPHRFSPGPSPSPSPILHRSTGPLPPNQHHPRKRNEDRPESGKSCSHCHATSTPLWRRDPSTMLPLCNACGLYLQQRNKLRPQELIDADDDGSSSDESDVNYVGPECTHCRTHHTSVWRRSKAGEQLCNACGVYARLRGKPRPLSLKRKKIRPRTKHSPK
ncbi:hypothetical protein CPC08DRAFT_698516 [Agrocybe pediades]|nr:hypothetical protein CPC08DRAFT_698516 [Agrocybe pediades]